MKLKLEIYGALCHTKIFEINEIEAAYEDFGIKGDNSPETAEEYGCGDMRFTRIAASQKILDKYKIDLNEYNTICDELEEKLSFGSCGWCV